MNSTLKFGLERFEMLNDENHSTGLVHVQKVIDGKFNGFSIEEIIAIENASTYGANYVYFRRFKDRPSIPQVYIYDFTALEIVTEDRLIELHKRLYSSGHVPMFFVFSNQDVRIFNCFDKPAKGDKLIYKPLTSISLAAKAIDELNSNEVDTEIEFRAFSGRSFDNGSFWDDSPYSKYFQFQKSAHEQLLTELKQALFDIINKDVLPSQIARKIMVISILIKYLEERKDENNNSVFPLAGQERIFYVNGKRQKKKYEASFFDQFSPGAKSFTDVLQNKGAGVKLFDYLGQHFNGGVFQLSESERNALQQCDLSRFGLFLEGKLQGVQFVFWRLYSFNDLPVELISNIYEEFLEKRPGVVYTPPYLVSFLLNEAMPLNNEQIDYKVLDPACGSGVFLVGAYRRLIYRWRKLNKWGKPSLQTLKFLLKNNIYGADKDEEAVNLTIFSLSLALCDELTPLQIWDDLEFDDLHNGNLFSADFFELLLNGKLKKHSFDLVIGNPPFDANLTDYAKKIETATFSSRLLTILDKGKRKKIKIGLPDNQIALLFLEQSVNLCKPGSLVCLIQPSGPLLYNNTSLQFRSVLFSKFNVPQIIDFTHISRVLFGKNGDVATAAIFIRNEEPKDKGVLHVTIRRTKANKEKIYFELDTYDFHYVSRQLALSDPYIWKSNFLGGSRYHQLISRLSSPNNINKYLQEKSKSSKWAYGEGFIQGKIDEIRKLEMLEKGSEQNALTDDDNSEYDRLRKKYKKAPHIIKKRLITDNFDSFELKSAAINNEIYFRYPSNEKLFSPPHILVKEQILGDQVPMMLSDDYLTFKHRIVGIHAPISDREQLETLYQYLQSNIVLFYLAGTSGEYMVNRSSSFLKRDLDNLPYSATNDFSLSPHERILVDEFWNYLLEFRRNGELSKLAINNVDALALEQYGKIYCEVLNAVYQNLKPYQPFETNSYICFPFYFNQQPVIEFQNPESSEKSIEKLVNKITGLSLRLTRVVRLYEGNVIYLIKPKKLRYWLKSVALRDADETFADLRKQGY